MDISNFYLICNDKIVVENKWRSIEAIFRI